MSLRNAWCGLCCADYAARRALVGMAGWGDEGIGTGGSVDGPPVMKGTWPVVWRNRPWLQGSGVRRVAAARPPQMQPVGADQGTVGVGWCIDPFQQHGEGFLGHLLLRLDDACQVDEARPAVRQ